MTLWQRSAFYDSWTSLYGYVPYALCFLLAAPQLFSDDKGAPTLGDLQKAGLGLGSSVSEIPSTDTLVTLARQRLGM